MSDSERPPAPVRIPVCLFPVGNLAITQGALASLLPADIPVALGRHVRGDWGELDEHDRNVNDSGLEHGGRLVSVYSSITGVRFYIITESDRSYSTILLPEEY